MNERCFVFTLRAFRFALSLVGAMLFGLGVPAEAQPAKKIPRIEYLSITRGGVRWEAFRQVLRELGYVEGKNIVIEYRWAKAFGSLTYYAQSDIETALPGCSQRTS